MREFYTTAEATQDSFLFVSYSHEDRDTVQQWVEFLIDRGVRVWWDKAFRGGDDWETIAEKLLSHENCSGILFFGGENAIKSPNVAKEWRTAAKTKASRAEDEFYAQIIMVTNENVDYKYLVKEVKKNDELYSDEDFDDFRALFGTKDHIYYVADKETEKVKLLDRLKESVKQVLNEHEVALDKLNDLANADKAMVLPLGRYGTGKTTLLWREIRTDNNQVTLLCQDVLTEEFGGKQLDGWVRQFVEEAFSSEEQAKLKGNVRLLTVAEAEQIPAEQLSANTLWWLSDRDGHLQAVVREDGTVYRGGYHGCLYKQGVRPVMTIDSVALLDIIKSKQMGEKH